MKNLVIVPSGRAAFGDVFRQNQLVAFQFTDFALIRADDSRAVRVHDAIKELVDLLFHGGSFQLERRTAFLRFLGATIPQIAEHGGRKLDQFARGRERAHKAFQRLFHPCPCHRLAVAGAATLTAHVIGIATAMPFGPIGRHGMVAIAAGDETAHREICVDVLAGRRTSFARQAILNEVEGFKRNQPVMLAFAQRQIPARHLDISGVKRLGQDLSDALMCYPPLLSLGKQRVGLEEAFHFGL